MTAMLKYLRITGTAVSLAACVLLVARWVRDDSDVPYYFSPRSGRPESFFKGCVIVYEQGRLQIYTRNTVTFTSVSEAFVRLMPQPRD
jgi:hypothetical protein